MMALFMNIFRKNRFLKNIDYVLSVIYVFFIKICYNIQNRKGSDFNGTTKKNLSIETIWEYHCSCLLLFYNVLFLT